MTPSVAGKALIYMTAHDSEFYVADALASLARQDHDDLHVLFVDDASNDDTADIARRRLADLFPGKHTLIRNDSAWGEARNAHVHLREYAQRADFVAVLGADDQLVCPTIVSSMATQYAAGKDVVWTNYITDRKRVGENGPLDSLESPRRQGWKTSHLFSFRAELLGNVDERYFRNAAGDWLPAACDLALAYPILDQTRRYHYIAEAAYRCTTNKLRPPHHAEPGLAGLESAIRAACEQEVLDKPPLDCTRPALVPVGVPAGVLTGLQPTSVARAPAAAATMMARRDAIDNPWPLAAAQRLAAECPALLDLMGAPGIEAFEPLQAWALHRLIATLRAAPRVLEIGHGPWAPMLAVLTRHRKGSFWSVGPDANRLATLQRQLLEARVTDQVALGTTTDLGGEVLGIAGRFPDLQLLGDAADFDLVFVSADHAVSDAASALQALPAASTRLSGAGFAFVLQTGSAELQRQAANTWRQLADDIDYREAACAGLGLLVSGR
ncbi:hypothetical protein BH11PSE9_BH11PSE9_14690 [soil metagenome]